MRNLFSRKSPEKTPEPPRSQSDDSLNELRRLLVGPLAVQLEEMQELLKDQTLNPEEVSKILPEAIMIRSSRDNRVVTAMEPVIEEAIKSSIRKDPRTLVEVLVPVMLPAIKKAITALIKEMIQTFSATLEHGLSMRGLKWRYEAFKTKKPFGEIALIHSLIYQVEQVFLIHKTTGLVLQSAASEDTIVQDPDMVSGMLTAIQDFVRDSFGGSQDDSLENLQFGDRSVWIEHTSQAVLAAVVWGNAPEDFRSVLRETLSTIHFEHIDNLRNFKGNTAPFEITKGRLSDCLRSRFKEKKHNPFIVWTLIALAFFGIGYGSFFSLRNYMRWSDYLDRLHKEPGIVITETKKTSGKYYVFGLRDPLSEDPAKILGEAKLEPEKVNGDWELYHSSHPVFIIRRISSILNPPKTVTFELKNHILYASGAAPRQWIADAEKLAETIPGVLGFESSGLRIADPEQIQVLGKKVGKMYFFFDTISAEIRPDQAHSVDELSGDIKELIQMTEVFGKDIHIEIVGHTDSIGTDERNLEVSRKRAEALFSALVSRGIGPEIFSVRGAGSKEPLREELTEADREMNRCVSFGITVTDRNVSSENAVIPGRGLPAASPSDPVRASETVPEPARPLQNAADSAKFGPL